MKQHTVLFRKQLAAWLVHLFTASTLVAGLFTLYAIHQTHYFVAFFWMGVAVFIDSVDGSLARFFDVKQYAAKIDGALLDNIADYFNYVITPCYLLLMHPSVLPSTGKDVIVSIVLLASAYQFTQKDAKTEDHFFKGFPSYWNFTVFYMFLFQTSPMTNLIALIILSILVFVPIKYVYLSRMTYLTNNALARQTLLALSILYGVVMVIILFQYPHPAPWTIYYVISYLILYFLVSLYRTIVPLPPTLEGSDHGR